jgi:acyl carrier protein
MVFEKIALILSDKYMIDVSKIKRETLLYEDLRADSLDAIELLMSSEAEFGIAIPETSTSRFKTVGDIADYIERFINE